MGIGSLFNPKTEQRSSDIPAYAMPVVGGSASTGTAVNENSALGLSAVWCAVNLISSTIGLFPLVTYRETGNRKDKAKDSPIYKLLHNTPNGEITKFDFFTILINNLLLKGAGCAEIEYDGRGQPIALWPIDTDKVTPERTASNRLIYKVQQEKGGNKVLQPHQMIVVRYSPKVDGGWRSVIGVHRESLSNQITLREYGKKIISNGVNPVSVVKGVKAGMTEPARKVLKDSIENYRSLGTSSKVMLLEKGLSIDKISMSLEDAEFIANQNFSISDIARIFNVPPILLHCLTTGTSTWGSGIHELMQGFIKLTIAPICKRIEDELNLKLVSVYDDDDMYCKFIMDGLLRGSYKDRTEAYKTAILTGWRSINEVREMEDLNPIDGGDKHIVPLNMASIETLLKENNDE